MADYFFNRIYKMTIGMTGKPGVVIAQPLHISFEITKTETPLGNVAKISVDNLADRTRSAIQKGMSLTLDVGYEEAKNTEQIFGGEITNVFHDVTRPNVTTVIECRDGYSVFKTTRISKTWAAGTPKSEILRKAIAVTGLSRGSTFSISGSTTSTFAFNGHVVDLISKICDDNGLRWSLQSGSIKVYPTGKTDGRVALKSQLIGSPRRMFKKATGNDTIDFDGWEIDCLLLARAEPGGELSFTSKENPKGVTIQVAEVKHSGDNYGDKWTSTIKGRNTVSGTVSNSGVAQ
jgi:hypothetical protein